MNKTMKHLDTLSKDNLVYLEADANYTLLHMRNGNKVHSSFTLKLHHEHFNDFVRVSRKYVVNPFFVKSVDSKNNKVMTKNGLSFLMSRRRIETVLERFEREGEL